MDIDQDMTVFTTGAYLLPVKLEDCWFWIVVGFEDDTYYDGECVSVRDYAEKKEELILKDEEGDEVNG